MASSSLPPKDTTLQTRIIETKKFYENHLLNAVGKAIVDGSVEYIGEYVFDIPISSILTEINRLINDPILLKLMKATEIPVSEIIASDIEIISRELERSLIRTTPTETSLHIILPEEAMKDDMSLIFHKRSKDIPNMISLSKQHYPLLKKIIEARNKHLSAVVKLVEEELLYEIRMNSIQRILGEVVIVDYHLAFARYCGTTPPEEHKSYIYQQYTPQDPSKWWENAGLPDKLTLTLQKYVVYCFTAKGCNVRSVSDDGVFEFGV